MNQLVQFDSALAEVRTQLQPMVALGQDMLARMRAQEITDTDTLRSAETIKKEATQFLSSLEDMRKKTKEPFLQAGRVIDDIAKEVATGAEQAKSLAQAKILEWEKKKQEEERKKQEARAKYITAIRTMPEEQFAKVFLDEELKKDPQIVQAYEMRKTQIENEKKQRELDAKLKEVADEKEQARIAQEKIDAQKRANEEERIRLEMMAQAQKQEAKEAEKAKAKNVREVTSFTITDEKALPRAYLMPDEKKIKEAIKNGVTEIAGVTITTEQVVR